MQLLSMYSLNVIWMGNCKVFDYKNSGYFIEFDKNNKIDPAIKPWKRYVKDMGFVIIKVEKHNE